MQIKIKHNGVWQYANPDQKQAFENFKNRPAYFPQLPITTNDLSVYRKYNDPYLPTYISDGQNEIPIADFDDVQVFLLDINPVDWHQARNYQVWAYYDFMYDNKQRKTYATKYSTYLAYPPHTREVTEIDIDDLQPNIIFSISRNENNSVYYERNDSNATRVRICDNNTARSGYRGFYTRMTMDVGLVVISSPSSSSSLSLPANLILEKTNNEEDQCIMCYSNKKNLIFNPCNHNITCSECYLNFTKKLECPICKGTILSLS
jgi:hypothetical protein